MSEKQPTMKDTKETILTAYKGVLEKLKAFEAGKMNPQAEIETKQKTALLEKVDTAVSTMNFENIFSAIEGELSGILDRIMAGTKTYAEIEQAIRLKEETLKELFAIEAEAMSLVALVNSREELARQYDVEMEAKRVERLTQILDLQQEYEKKKQAMWNEKREEEAKIAKDRTREREEYEYKFNREKQQKLDELNDEILAKQRAFNEKCEAFSKELNDREAELSEREEVVSKREARLDDLETVIETLKADRETAIAEAVEKAKSDERAKFYAELNGAKKDGEHKVALIQSKLEVAESALTKANETIETLTTKLENAYAEIRQIANATIEASANKQVINQLERLASNNQKSN